MENGCVFCDTSKLEERLIHENKDFYVVATLGQITDGGYVLLIPKEHVACMGALTSERMAVGFELAEEIYNALELEYCLSVLPTPVIMFEHGIVGQTVKHAHVHFMPAFIDFTPKIHADFPTIEIEELGFTTSLEELYCKHQEPYLFWTTPDYNPLICWNPPAPAQYLRTVAAELLGRPERGNWRNMDPELDKRLCAETIARLKPYFT